MVRSGVSQGISRCDFTIEGSTMVFVTRLHQEITEASSVRCEDGRDNDWQTCDRSKVMKEQHIGSNFDDFLREENLLDVAEATAVKRVIAFQTAQELKLHKGDQVRSSESDEDSPLENAS